MCGRVFCGVVLLAVSGVAGAGEVARVWADDAERRYPPADWIPPGADRSEFTVVSSEPFAVVERAERPAREQRQTWRRRSPSGAVPSTAESSWRRHRSRAAFSTPLAAWRRDRPAYTTAQADSDADGVLERYPAARQLWTPYTEDPAPARRKRPLLTPDTGFVLEHEFDH